MRPVAESNPWFGYFFSPTPNPPRGVGGRPEFQARPRARVQREWVIPSRASEMQCVKSYMGYTHHAVPVLWCVAYLWENQTKMKTLI